MVSDCSLVTGIVFEANAEFGLLTWIAGLRAEGTGDKGYLSNLISFPFATAQAASVHLRGIGLSPELSCFLLLKGKLFLLNCKLLQLLWISSLGSNALRASSWHLALLLVVPLLLGEAASWTLYLTCSTKLLCIRHDFSISTSGSFRFTFSVGGPHQCVSCDSSFEGG